ncbi:MAG: hypothetical protein JO307_20915 [Bryobacterales bacterium]|nr:hypothetical protein [Bryobacterales bacterium]
MKIGRRLLRYSAALLICFGVAWACGFDWSLREYFSARFWLPFARQVADFEKTDVNRVSEPFAGMGDSRGDAPLAKLRAAYQEVSQPINEPFDFSTLRQASADARADSSLSKRDREEVDLIDAKIDMREHMPGETELLLRSKSKLEQFLNTAQTPEFLSEARGWLAHIDLALGNQTAAGKIYLDELNRDGSNLSRDTVLTSLSRAYGYDRGTQLLEHLDDYFDTAEHAAFAIQMVTNPRQVAVPNPRFAGDQPEIDSVVEAYGRIQGLLARHQDLWRSESGVSALGLLSLRTALRAGDPPGALKIAAMIPADAAIRSEPDFQWMLGSAYFLTHNFAAAEQPLLNVYQSASISPEQRASAVYGLVGVYRKTNNVVEEIRFALGLTELPAGFSGFAISWSSFTFDLSLLLDAEAPIPAMEEFLAKYAATIDVKTVKYALAVRLARADRYEEAARIFESIGAPERAERMHRMDGLYREANRADLPAKKLLEEKYALAEYIASNQDRLYFNDTLWSGMQNYALHADQGSEFTKVERQAQIVLERKLRDDQEERWRAYLILRGIVQESGETEVGRKAAKLAISCVRKINPRFGRSKELIRADLELSTWLRQP